MPMFITFLVLFALSIVFPNLTKYFIVSPILGFITGGFVWCGLVLFSEGDTFANAQSFFGFMIGGTIIFWFILSQE